MLVNDTLRFDDAEKEEEDEEKEEDEGSGCGSISSGTTLLEPC